MHRCMQTLDLDELAHVCGGMNLEGMPESTNVEDRRGLTRKQSMAIKPTLAPPLPPLVRTPGDLPSQLGLDDIKLPPRKRR